MGSQHRERTDKYPEYRSVDVCFPAEEVSKDPKPDRGRGESEGGSHREDVTREFEIILTPHQSVSESFSLLYFGVSSRRHGNLEKGAFSSQWNYLRLV